MPSSLHRVTAAAMLATGLAACGDDGDPAASAPPVPHAALIDAAVAPPAPTVVPPYDPASGYHLDDEGTFPTRRPDRPTATRDRRVLQLMLVSTPSGAIAAVDGRVVGRTPTYWEGDFTGRDREFTFVMPGYSMARYRFVPVQDGFVHGQLHRITTDGDAGVPEIPVPELEPPVTLPALPSRDRRPTPTPPPAPTTVDAAAPPADTLDAAGRATTPDDDTAPAPADAGP